MTDHSELVEAVTRMLRDRCSADTVRSAESTGWAGDLWTLLADAGLPWISVPEGVGGSGGTLADACAMLFCAGRFAAPLPLAETGILGGWLLARAGLHVPTAPVTVATGGPGDAVHLERGTSGWTLSGVARRVPWAAASGRISLLVPHGDQRYVVSVCPSEAAIAMATNVAGEPRETVEFNQVPIGSDSIGIAPDDVTVEALQLRGALSRAVLMSGALDRITADALTYSGVREQFGRPIGRFQAVQGLLVQAAEQAACADLAARVAIQAVEAAPSGLPFFEIASAKIVAGEAAGRAAAAVHQVHGAIGMTKEHQLHAFTRRLWAWREEFGPEQMWSRRLGDRLLAQGGDALWPSIATDQVMPVIS